jgi:hypothetical protein
MESVRLKTASLMLSHIADLSLRGAPFATKQSHLKPVRNDNLPEVFEPPGGSRQHVSGRLPR